MLTLRVPALLFLLAVPGLFTPWPWWWLAGVVLLLAVLVGLDLMVAGAVRDLRAERVGDRQVRAGSTATVRLRVSNEGVRPVQGRIRDAWVPSAGARSTPDSGQLVTIEPGETVEVVTELTPIRRGDRPAVRVTVRSYWPTGRPAGVVPNV